MRDCSKSAETLYEPSERCSLGKTGRRGEGCAAVGGRELRFARLRFRPPPETGDSDISKWHNQ